MNQRLDREAAKRRIMFVASEDFYFLTYTLFVLLNELRSFSHENALVDFRKLAYLSDFLGSDDDLALATTTVTLSSSGRSRLTLIYDRAVSRRAAVERLIEALVYQGHISVVREVGQPGRVHLVASPAIKAFVEDSTYQGERRRIKAMRKHLPQLRTMTVSRMRERLFDERGVRTWGD